LTRNFAKYRRFARNWQLGTQASKVPSKKLQKPHPRPQTFVIVIRRRFTRKSENRQNARAKVPIIISNMQMGLHVGRRRMKNHDKDWKNRLRTWKKGGGEMIPR
jgi:hypothetical protein